MYKVLLSVRKHLHRSETNVPEQFHEIGTFRRRLKIIITVFKDPGMLQREKHYRTSALCGGQNKRLINEPDYIFIGKHLFDVSPYEFNLNRHIVEYC